LVVLWVHPTAKPTSGLFPGAHCPVEPLDDDTVLQWVHVGDLAQEQARFALLAHGVLQLLQGLCCW
jgi:hypothetical protein